MRTAKVADEYLRVCRERGLAELTLEKYRWGLAILAEHCPVLPRRGGELAAVVNLPQHGLETRRKLRVVLSTFYRWAGRRYRWPNPVAELERLRRRRRRLPRVLTELEVEQILGACRTPRDRALVALVLETGLRLCELARLRWRDIGPDYITIRDSKSDDRVVSVRPAVKQLLLGLGDLQHVWVGKRGPLTRSGVQQAYRRLMRRAGLEGPKVSGPHLLRHTFATQYIAGGGNHWALMEVLGHESIATTQIYVTLARTQVAADHAQHSPVATWGLLEKFG